MTRVAARALSYKTTFPRRCCFHSFQPRSARATTSFRSSSHNHPRWRRRGREIGLDRLVHIHASTHKTHLIILVSPLSPQRQRTAVSELASILAPLGRHLSPVFLSFHDDLGPIGAQQIRKSTPPSTAAMHRDYSDDSDDEPLAAQRIQQQQPQQKTAAPKTQAKRPSQPQAQQQQPDRATSSRRMGNEEPRPEQGTDRTSHATNGGSHHHLDEQNGQEVQPAQRGSAGEGGSSRGPNLDVNYKIKFYKMRDRYTRAQAVSASSCEAMLWSYHFLRRYADRTCPSLNAGIIHFAQRPARRSEQGTKAGGRAQLAPGRYCSPQT